jgi:hypothetical protein
MTLYIIIGSHNQFCTSLSVVLFNTNQNIGTDGKPIEGSENDFEHAKNAWRYLFKNYVKDRC